MFTHSLLQRRLVAVAAIVSGAFFVLVAPAYAGQTFYVKPAGDDTNSCVTTARACATVDGALDKVADQANPQDSTIVLLAGTYESFDVSGSGDSLDGLTIRTADGQGRAIIDANGDTAAVDVYYVSDLTLKNLDITGFTNYGIYTYGNAEDHIDGLTIQNTVVHHPDASTSTQYGMYLYAVDGLTVTGSTVRDFAQAIDANSTSKTVYGMYVSQAEGARITNNRFSNIRPTANRNADNKSLYAYAKGLDVNRAVDSRIKNNSFIDIGPELTVDATNSDTLVYAYGLDVGDSAGVNAAMNTFRRVAGSVDVTGQSYGSSISNPLYYSSSVHSTIRKNTITGNSPTASADEEFESAGTSVTAIEVYGIEDIAISRNTITNNQATSSGDTTGGYAESFGIFVDALDGGRIDRNVIANNTATHQNSDADSMGIRVRGGGEMYMYRNRIRDFLVDGADDGTNYGAGIQLGTRAKAKVFNNLIYLTDAPSTDEHYGMRIVAQTATPLFIYHNTMNNVSGCFEIREMKRLELLNNLCRMNHADGYAVEVSSDEYDLSRLKSNFNAFVNAAGPVRFNDTDEGTMGATGWRKGDYGFDKKSKTGGVKLVLDSSKRRYLHTKKRSSARKAGKKKLKFVGDADTTDLLKRDYANKLRGSKKIRKKKVRRRLGRARKIVKPTIGAFEK